MQCAFAAKSIVPGTQPGQFFFRQNRQNHNDLITISFTITYHICYVRFNVSFNLTKKNLFKMHDDVYLCSYAVIRLGVCYKTFKDVNVQCKHQGKYTSNVNIELIISIFDGIDNFIKKVDDYRKSIKFSFLIDLGL